MTDKQKTSREYSRNYTWMGSFAAFLWVVNGCGTEPIHVTGSGAQVVEQAIINGQRCVENEFPSSVEILVDADVDFGPWGQYHLVSQICGGTLIAPDVVLTAAHCLDSNSLTNGMGKLKKVTYWVTPEANLASFKHAAEPAIPQGATMAKSWSVHQDYNPDAFEGSGLGEHKDIGILFLSKALDIEPALVITQAEAQTLAKGSTVSIVGWGQQVPEEDEAAPPTANDGYKMCASSSINELSQHEMQIGSDKESKRKCYGDSGGASYVTIKGAIGNPSRLIGITSHAYDSNACYKGGVDTRVDAYLDWIDGKMKEGCNTGARVWCESKGIIQPPTPPSAVRAVASRIWEYVLSWIYG
jgi:secreted trypsin-like serine protease